MSSNQQKHPTIPGLPTGVSGLDEVLGEGGIPEYSFTLIAGGPGAGKTTLAQQIMFNNATVERPAIYFTVLGEPPLKMMRYLHQRSFFDVTAVNRSVRFVNLSKEAMSGDLEAVYSAIVREIEASGPAIVIVDSFRSVERVSTTQSQLSSFVQRLALHLTSWQATTFLLGEYSRSEVECDAVFTVADGVLWMQQTTQNNTVVRKLQVVKMRGRNAAPGLHSYRTVEGGIEVFPNMSGPLASSPLIHQQPRVASGVPGLDDLLGGGLPTGAPVLLVGPSGTGKSVLATQLLSAAGLRGEVTVLALFEETPGRYRERARSRLAHLPELERDGKLHLLHIRALDFSVPQMMHDILSTVRSADARLVVIDSVTGLELSLEPSSRLEFRQALYRLVMNLSEVGVSVIMTLEQMEEFSQLKFSDYAVSFLADTVIWLRYVEIRGALQKVISVVKVRDKPHSSAFCALKIDDQGAHVGAQMDQYRGMLTGVLEPAAPAAPGLSALEQRVLRRLIDERRVSVDQLTRTERGPADELQRALSRLARLGFATKVVRRDGSSRYRLGGRRGIKKSKP
jgi:circadian clock protein KaiC